MSRVLIVDDDRSVLHVVKKSLEQAGFEVATSMAQSNVIELLKEVRPDVLLLDVVLPGASGLDLFAQIKSVDKKLPVIFITACGNSQPAISAMQQGAFDYLTKPLDLPSLAKLVRKASEVRRLMSVPVAAPIPDHPSEGGDAFIGKSPRMLEVFKQIGRVASQKVAVLIRGESGTGKELVARAIYQNSDRSGEPFLSLNCAAIPDSLLESELFGHEKGSFSGADRQRIGKFEQANGGTIFLDEVGDMSPLVQGKVLRLLQEQRFERIGGNQTLTTDVRIIAATNRNLEQMVKANEFREDLFYRLNGVTIFLPPLRERREDIQPLVEYFLTVERDALGKAAVEGISPEALELLKSYDWPGNVRELQNCLRQALINAIGPVIVPEFLTPEVRGEADGIARPLALDNNGLPELDLASFIERRLACKTSDLYAETLQELERYLFTRVLKFTGGNQTKAAEILGVTRGKVRDRVSAFEITVDKQVQIEKND